MQTNELLESLCIKAPIEHSTTCDSRIHMNCISQIYTIIAEYILLLLMADDNYGF